MQAVLTPHANAASPAGQYAPGDAGPAREQFFSRHCPPGVDIVGRSEAMEAALADLRLVGESGCNPVLIVGETGAGKELAARAVHAWRCGGRERPFVAVNCAALTANLLESELFGHVKGAFTGADRDKTGLLEAADDGTILLDEISEMPPELQAKLLRVLQEQTFRPVGGMREIACRCTVVATSNRNLLEEVDKGNFRKDLYYRLAVFPVRLPALGDAGRIEDVPLLAEHFLATSDLARRKGIGGISPRAAAKLEAHAWPGNVRELRNVITRAVMLERGRRIDPASIRFDGEQPPQAPRRPQHTATGEPAAMRIPLPDFSLESAERELIVRALKETGWQRTRAAGLLGITRATLHAKIKRYDLTIPGGKATAGAA